MKTPLACRVPGSRQIGASQVNDIGAKLLHFVEIEGGVRDTIPHRYHDGVGWKGRERGCDKISQHGVVVPVRLFCMDSDANGEHRARAQGKQAQPGTDGGPDQSLQESGKSEPRGNRQ